MAHRDDGAMLDWNKHEAEIRDLLETKRKPLREVREHMSTIHNFNAT